MSVLFVIFGILLMGSGISSMFYPVSSALSTGLFFGIFMGVMFLSNGINGLFFDRQKKSFWSVLLDILMIVLGLSIIFTDTGVLRASTFMIIYFGTATVFAGVSRIIVGINLKKAGFPCLWIILSAILSVIAGFIIILNPVTGLFTFDFMLSIMAIVMGCNMVVIGFKN